jgi:hypothetical protein
MSYAQDLAKDRDKYLRQRNKLASALRNMLADLPDMITSHSITEAHKVIAEIDRDVAKTSRVLKV